MPDTPPRCWHKPPLILEIDRSGGSAARRGKGAAAEGGMMRRTLRIAGIGLAMTFRIVQLHDGTIDFTSEPGKGTSFVIRLPIAV